MTKRTGCKARQTSDQMTCDACGLVWDVNDPDPPACLSQQRLGVQELEHRKRMRARIRRLREQIEQREQ